MVTAHGFHLEDSALTPYQCDELVVEALALEQKCFKGLSICHVYPLFCVETGHLHVTSIPPDHSV